MSSKRKKNPLPITPRGKASSRSRDGNSPDGKKKGGDARPATGREARRAARKGNKKEEKAPAEPVTPISPTVRWVVAGLLLAAFVWAYFPTLALLQSEWERLPDYSHGYLVVPFAILLGYLRRDSMPQLSPRLSFAGLILIAMGVAVRWVGDTYFFPALGSFSIPLWVAGSIWLIGGWRFGWWALPSVAFLLFMIPLPSRFGPILSGSLQRIATIISTWLLQLIGQPALSEGNTIVLGENVLEVEQACSGLRIFVSILALAFFFIFMAKRPWWQSLAIAFSTLPIALAANALRIVFTGILMQNFSGEAAHKFSHDFAGWVMIPVACLFFVAFLWYLSHLVVKVENVDITTVSRRGKPSGGEPTPAST